MRTIKKTTPRVITPRTRLVEGRFDLPTSDTLTTEIYALPRDNLDEKPWNIGLVVGPSGSGKSVSATEAFGTLIENYPWDDSVSVLDNFPKGLTIDEIVGALSSVGFSSPPAWIRPFGTLSNGERFRATLARALLETSGVIAIDEFTSVVDRTVAQIGSYAVSKAIRRTNKQFVAVSCHYDIEEWLQPDWVYEPASGDFRWRSVQPRPDVTLEIRKAEPKKHWSTFAKHHYLTPKMSWGSKGIVVYVEGELAAICTVIFQPHPRKNNHYRVHRLVVLPDFQGLGLSKIILDLIGGAYVAQQATISIATSHPALIGSLKRSPTWEFSRGGVLSPHSSKMKGYAYSITRATATFEYVGDKDSRLVKFIHAKRTPRAKCTP